MTRPYTPAGRHRLRPLPLGLRPQRWQRWSVHAATLALALTGIAWLIAHHLMRSTGAFGEELPSPLEPWALRLHGMLAPVFLLVLGSMATVHVVLGWRSGRSLWSGCGLIAASLLLLASGLALYYAPEHWHGAASLLHWAVGLVLAPLLWLHVRAGRRWRRAAVAVSAG